MKLSERLGNFLFAVIPYRKKVILNNLKIYLNFASRPLDELNYLAKKNYQHLAALFLEGFKLPHLTEKELLHYIQFDKTGDILNQLKSEKKAVVLLGHLGNWEFIAAGLGKLIGEPVYFVTKKLTNPMANFYMHRMREKFSDRMIPMEYSREILNQQLNMGNKIAMAGDQSAHVESYWDNFMGVPCPVFLGAASFALKNNAPLYLLVPIRQRDGRFIVFGEKIKSDDLDRTKKESLYVLTTRHVKALESYILKYPEQYYWIHKRWKHANKAGQYFHLYH